MGVDQLNVSARSRRADWKKRKIHERKSHISGRWEIGRDRKVVVIVVGVHGIDPAHLPHFIGRLRVLTNRSVLTSALAARLSFTVVFFLFLNALRTFA